ncbi:MAG: response regulator, partial [Spirochaetaceae bacterium]|nr:response regulator [Spirochaetaceae bacterium]
MAADVGKILIVDDDASIRKSIELTIGRRGYRSETASGSAEALARLGTDTDAVILDLFLGNENGRDVLLKIREADPLVPVIMISGLATVDDALECVRLGAFDYIQKPLHPGRLLVSIENAARLSAMRRQMIGQILPVYSSSSMAKVVGVAEKVSQTRSAVLITGESGTGKDLIAQLIHSLSPRSRRPLVRINCGALPE